jgi:protein-disulfide isomerase
LDEVTTSTPTRKEQRERARVERQRREQEEALRAQRKRRLMYLGGGLLVLIAAVAIAIAVASGGGSGSSSSTGAGSGSGVTGASAVANEFAGIPQKGNTLGASSAPATMMVFADMQCPYCKQFETQVFPSLVRRYVKTGKLKVVFQPIAIIGSDSVTGARAVGSAAQQNKMFDYASLFYDNQGQENTGYVTQDFLTKLANATPGLDTAKWKSQLNSPAVENLLGQAQSASQTAGVSSTPTFLVAKTGKPLQQFQVTSLTPNAFYGKLDALTR